MGHLIPAGTGLKKFRDVLVSSKEESKGEEKIAVPVESGETEEEVVVVKKTRKRTKTVA
jgi:hypothetical protein